jgi:hypothetical protein
MYLLLAAAPRLQFQRGFYRKILWQGEDRVGEMRPSSGLVKQTSNSGIPGRTALSLQRRSTKIIGKAAKTDQQQQTRTMDEVR